MKKYLLILLLAVLVAGTAYHSRFVIVDGLFRDQHFANAGDNIFIERGVTQEGIQRLLASVAEAKARIENTFGPRAADPVILIANTDETTRLFGSNAYGATLRSVWGQYVVIGPKGQNVDVIAHELLHTEIEQRLGYMKVITELPVWFDEGLAVAVDNRDPYRLETIDVSAGEIVAIKDAFYAHTFFGGDSVVKNYQAAKVAVAHVVGADGYTSVFKKLERVGAGESFASVFDE